MKIVFSVKFFFGDFECSQMAYYHFIYKTYGTRRYPIGYTKNENKVVAIFVLFDLFFQIFKKTPKKYSNILESPTQNKKKSNPSKCEIRLFHSLKITDLIFIFPEG